MSIIYRLIAKGFCLQMGAYIKLQKQIKRPEKGFSESLLVNSFLSVFLKKKQNQKNVKEVRLKKKDSAMKEFKKKSCFDNT